MRKRTRRYLDSAFIFSDFLGGGMGWDEITHPERILGSNSVDDVL
jgi:hypothetical protein